MRMLFVVITGMSLLFFITLFWYVSQPIITGIASAAFGTLTTEAQNTVDLVEFCSIIWGPVLDIFVIVWMVASAQMRDVESDIYG